MFWSIYDTLLLLAGLITAAIAFIPLPTIPSKTRVIAGAVGGGIVLLSLIVGNMPSFTYPSGIFVAPLIALAVGGVIIKSALDLKKQQDAAAADPDHGQIQYGEQGHAAAVPVAPPVVATVAPPVATAAPAEAADPRTGAWEELHNPSTPPARLAEIAAAHPEFASTIAAHPNAYPGLQTWAAFVAAGETA
jgi:hypothetical protein